MKPTTWFLIAVAGVFAGAGALLVILQGRDDERSVALVIQLFCAPLLFEWCKAHCRARGVSPPTAAPLLVAFVPPIGVPYYFFRSMSARRASKSTILAAGYYALINLCAGATAYLTMAVLT